MSRRGMSLCLIALLAVVMTGCTQKEAAATGGVICSYQWWVGPVGVLVGVAAIAWGWVNRSGGWRNVMFLVAATLATVSFSPFGFFDRAIVDKDHLETRWGFWCFPTTHHIRFDDVTGVRLISETNHSRRGRRTSYHLMFQLKSGQSEKVTADNSLMQEIADDLIAAIRQRPITFVDATTE